MPIIINELKHIYVTVRGARKLVPFTLRDSLRQAYELFKKRNE